MPAVVLTISEAAQNAACNAVVDLIDVGSGTANLVLGDTGMANSLVSCAFGSPAFGDAAVGVATANTITDGTVGIAGTATEAKITNKNGVSVIYGLTVGLAATNVILTNNVFNIGDKVSVTSATVTMPAQ